MRNNEKKNKHMTLDDRIEIQECLSKGMAFIRNIVLHIKRSVQAFPIRGGDRLFRQWNELAVGGIAHKYMCCTVLILCFTATEKIIFAVVLM